MLVVNDLSLLNNRETAARTHIMPGQWLWGHNHQWKGFLYVYVDRAPLLPNLHTLVGIEPHFIAFFDVKGFVKFRHVGKRAVNAHKAR